VRLNARGRQVLRGKRRMWVAATVRERVPASRTALTLRR
jgi:hypothetical protein